MKYLSPFNLRYGISPFSSGSFSTMEKEIEKLFGNLPSLYDGGGEWLAGSDSKSLNPIWFEHDEAYVVQVELPGVESKNVTLEVVSNILKLSAERETRSEKPRPTMDLPLDKLARPPGRNSQPGSRCSPSHAGAATQLIVLVSLTKH